MNHEVTTLLDGVLIGIGAFLGFVIADWALLKISEWKRNRKKRKEQ